MYFNIFYQVLEVYVNILKDSAADWAEYGHFTILESVNDHEFVIVF